MRLATRRTAVLLFLLFLLFLLTFATTPAPVTAQGSSVSSPVSLSLPLFSGDTLRVGAGERPTLVAVFATWCRTCRDEVATFNALERELASRGVRFVALSADEIGDERVRAWAARAGVRYPMSRAWDTRPLRALGVVGVPEAHLVDRHGIVRWSRRGPIDGGLRALRTVVETLGKDAVTHSPK